MMNTFLRLLEGKHWLFLLFFIYGVFFNGFFIFEHFSIDSYVFSHGQSAMISIVGTGRGVYGLLMYFLDKINISVVQYQFFGMMLGIMFLAGAATILTQLNYSVLQKRENYNSHFLYLVAILSAVLIVFNGFQNSMTPFVEMFPGSCLALFLTVVGIDLFFKKQYIRSTLIVLVSLFIYQSWVSIFIVFVFIFFYFTEKKNIFSSLFWSGVMYSFLSLFNFYCSKIFVSILKLPSWRIKSINFYQVIEHVKIIPGHIMDLYTHSYTYLPKNFLLYSVLLLLLSIGVQAIRKKDFRSIAGIFVVIVLASLIPILPMLVSEDPYITIRMMIAMPSVIGVVIFLYFFISLGAQTQWLSITVFFIGTVTVAVFLVYSWVGGKNMIDVNRDDERSVIILMEEILKQESAANTEVHTIAFVEDAAHKSCRTSVCMPSISESFFIADWANMHGFNYYSHKNFGRIFQKASPSFVLSDDEIQLIKTRNFEDISADQVFIKGDTAVIIIY